MDKDLFHKATKGRLQTIRAILAYILSRKVRICGVVVHN